MTERPYQRGEGETPTTSRPNRSAIDEIVADWLSEAKRCVALAAEFVSRHTEAEFLADEHLQNSASMLLVRLREVVRRLPDEFKAQYPDVPWHQIAGMGNVVAHEYAMVADMRLVWQTILVRLPELGDRLGLRDSEVDGS